MTTWTNTFKELPTSNTTVWIVRTPSDDKPALADFVLATSKFEWLDSNGNTHQLNAEQVFKWRPA
jgi:hypothetical protein